MSPISFVFAAVLMLAAWVPLPSQAATKPDLSGFRNAATAKAGKTPKAAAGRVQRESAGASSARRNTAVTREVARTDSRKRAARGGSTSAAAKAARPEIRQAGGLAAGRTDRTDRTDRADRAVGSTKVSLADRPGRAAVTVPAGLVGAAVAPASAALAASVDSAASASSAASAAAAASAASAAPMLEAVERAATVSLGAALGLHRMNDPLDLRSGSALVIERDTGKVLFEKNPQYVLPIASLTKLMTAMVVLDAGQSFDELIEVTADDRDTDRFSASHLPVGARVTRREMLQLALMASENRAAAALARTYPGGFTAYVEAANRKAATLGMIDSVFADGTGLSASNVATVHDLAKLVSAASDYVEIAQWSLAPSLSVRLPRGSRSFHTTNRLVGSPNWQLELQKTGYITEAGNCLLLQARVDNRSLIVVLLDSYGRYSRIGDAERIRRWLQDPA